MCQHWTKEWSGANHPIVSKFLLLWSLFYLYAYLSVFRESMLWIKNEEYMEVLSGIKDSLWLLCPNSSSFKALIPSVMVFGDGTLGACRWDLEGRAVMTRLFSSLGEEEIGELSFLCAGAVRRQPLTSPEGDSPGLGHAGPLISDFLASGTERNKRVLFEPPGLWHSVWAG